LVEVLATGSKGWGRALERIGGAIAPCVPAKGNGGFTGRKLPTTIRRTSAAALERGGELKTVTRSELTALVGSELGVSDWFLIDQARVDRFAEVTLDDQFLHVDPERAKATPFGGTIAHGFLTLSLLTPLCLPFIPELANRKLVVNYGFDKVRFAAPVRVGKRIRAVAKLGTVEERKPGNVIVRLDVTVEIEGEDKPALVAEWLSMHILAAA
jgi:acyl dehydratase